MTETRVLRFGRSRGGNVSDFVLRISNFTLLFFYASAITVFAEENPLIELHKVIPRIVLDIRYATPNNFMGEALYSSPRCYLRRETAAKLSKVQALLEKEGLGLKVFDGYRPLSVQKKMWARFPLEGYIANPQKGSNHNRGAAVDVTLVDAEGRELPMPSAYDEFSDRAHRDFDGCTLEEKRNREILRLAMEKHGFKGLETEWWHFDDVDAKTYPLLDIPVNGAVGSRGNVNQRNQRTP